MPLQNILKDSIHIVDHNVKKIIKVCFANMIIQTLSEKEYSVEDLKTNTFLQQNTYHPYEMEGSYFVIDEKEATTTAGLVETLTHMLTQPTGI